MLYRIVLVSAKHQHESAMGIRTSPPSGTHLPPHPTALGCHRAPQQIPTGSLFYIRERLCLNATVRSPHPLLLSMRLQVCCLCLRLHSVQFSSVTQSCPTLCDPMNHSTPGLPVQHHLPEFTQTHVYGVSDAIQPSHPLPSPSPPAPNPSQHQSLFQ